MELNRRYAAQWPSITATQIPLPTAEGFKDVEHKRHLFDPNPAKTPTNKFVGGTQHTVPGAWYPAPGHYSC